MKLQSILLILIGTQQAVSDDEDNDWSGEELNCLEKLQLNKATIRRINKKMITPENDVDFNNFLSCYWKRKGIQDNDGDIQFDKLDDLLLVQILKEFGGNIEDGAATAAEIVGNALYECRKRCIRGKTHGQTAAMVQNCIATEVQLSIAELYRY